MAGKRKTIIYIAGYGRSGSTLLDIILGNNSSIVNTGELNTVFDEYLAGYYCSCGKQYLDCNFWSKFRGEIQDVGSFEKLQAVFHKIDRRETIYAPWEKHISHVDEQLYKCAHDKLFDCLESQIIVDSSKTASSASYRPIALKKLCGYDVKVIHIERKLKNVLKSLNKGSNKEMQGKDITRLSLWSQLFPKKDKQIQSHDTISKFANVIRGVVGYFLANKEAKKLKNYIGKDNYINVTFEKLVDDPVNLLLQIENKFDLDLAENIDKIKNNNQFYTGHLIGGNRVAEQKEVQINCPT